MVTLMKTMKTMTSNEHVKDFVCEQYNVIYNCNHLYTRTTGICLLNTTLYNLQKNPEKEYIHWPNRTAIIDKQIEKIKAVTRYYERV